MKLTALRQECVFATSGFIILQGDLMFTYSHLDSFDVQNSRRTRNC